VIEIVKEDLASGHQSTSRADGQYVIRNLLASSCYETIQEPQAQRQVWLQGEPQDCGPDNTVGLLLLDCLDENVNRYFQEQRFKSVVFLGTTVAFDALGSVQKFSVLRQICNNSAAFMKHFTN
jgi:hypothetical protein